MNTKGVGDGIYHEAWPGEYNHIKAQNGNVDTCQPEALVLRFARHLASLYALSPVIGCEVEFYIIGSEGEQLPHSRAAELIDNLHAAGINICKEKGMGQFETQLGPSKDLGDVIHSLRSTTLKIQHLATAADLRVSYGPKPYLEDYGSAMHLHIHLADQNNVNVFSTSNIGSNTYLTKSINGILELLLEGLYYFGKEEDFDRFKAGFMAPTNISWGGNNRTTAIRVPDALPEHRRIEFRVPSADSDIEKVITFLLAGIIHGLGSDEIHKYKRIYGNAFDKQYALQSFPESLKASEQIFHARGILKKYLLEI